MLYGNLHSVLTPCPGPKSFVLCLLGWVALLYAMPAASAELKTQNLILVTLDGVRVQEVFSGLDETIAIHDQQQIYSEIDTGRARYGQGGPEQRRAALLPNLWNHLAPQGMVLGNPAYDNHVKVQNRILWSTPGYTEMMTGGPKHEVTDNENYRFPFRTALDLAREELDLQFGDIAQIGSWDGFKLAASGSDGGFLMVGAHEAIPPPYNTPETDYLAKLRREVMGLWEEGSDDVLTFHMVNAFVKKNQPRVLWWALKDSDDWAHADRYDRYLEFLHMADRLIGELWNTIQAMDFYRDKTTLIITGDHGRGLQGKDWAEHDITIPGSDDIWLAVIGPDTPDLGEMTTPGTVYQGQVAATILHYLGVDYLKLDPKALPPVLPGD